ncbi:MAG: hypothetical protein LBB75_00105 [Oscillospiraceae bacterium]|nr:hypothetical protein [Oscillospiraceae bacterium]
MFPDGKRKTHFPKKDNPLLGTASETRRPWQTFPAGENQRDSKREIASSLLTRAKKADKMKKRSGETIVSAQDVKNKAVERHGCSKAKDVKKKPAPAGRPGRVSLCENKIEFHGVIFASCKP